MQIEITEVVPPLTIFTAESEYEFFEPKRIVVSPLELCLLSEPEDLFEDD